MDKYNLIRTEQIKQKGTFVRSTTKAFIITMMNNHQSVVGARRCIQSIKNTKSKLDPFILDATTPDNLLEHLSTFKMDLSDWTYPKSPSETKTSIDDGLILTGYSAADYTKVVSCLVSHMRLWRMCLTLGEPIVILEHDAMFTREFDMNLDFAMQMQAAVIGLNDPIGATRKAKLYDSIIRTKMAETNRPHRTKLSEVPTVDDLTIPQGIAGNSAYLISPYNAAVVLNRIFKKGMWPNDALMCKQLFPTMIQQAFPYFTKVQGTASTTTS